MKANLIKFCFKCGNKIDFRTVEGKKRFVCNKCNTISYLNSKPCVGALIICNKQILLTKREYKPYKNYWDIPGGFLESKEHPEKGLKREMKEELGIEIKIEKIFGIYMDEYGEEGFPTLNIFYLCRHLSEPKFFKEDIIEYKWFSINKLPDKIAFKSARDALCKLKDYLLTDV